MRTGNFSTLDFWLDAYPAHATISDEAYTHSTPAFIFSAYASSQALRARWNKGITQVLRQMQACGYTLIYALDHGEIVAASGFRVSEFLGWGKTLYVDDLITNESDRGKGYGGALMDWIFHRAEEFGCEQIHLDSGVHRHDAHRLYLNKKMDITCHHFAKKI